MEYRGSLRKYLVGTGKARSAAAARAKLKLGPIINYNRCAAKTLIGTLLLTRPLCYAMAHAL